MLSASKIAFMPALALHSAMPKPSRKPKVSLPSLRPAMRVISSRRGRARRRNDIGGEREMVGDRGRVGKERIDRHARGDGREQRDQRIEHDAGGEREQPVVLDLVVGADEDVLPAAPGDMHGRRRLAAPALLAGARFLQRQRLDAGFSDPNARLGLAAVVVALHGIDRPPWRSAPTRQTRQSGSQCGIRGRAGSYSGWLQGR